MTNAAQLRLDSGAVVAPPRVTLRDGDPGVEDVELVLRFSVEDRSWVVKNALGSWELYRNVLGELGRSGTGALVLSAFAVRDIWTVEQIASHERRPRRVAFVQGSTLVEHGIEVWATSIVSVDGELDPRHEVHYDVVVTTDAWVVDQPGLSGSKAERQEARNRVLELIEPILDLWAAPDG